MAAAGRNMPPIQMPPPAIMQAKPPVQMPPPPLEFFKEATLDQVEIYKKQLYTYGLQSVRILPDNAVYWIGKTYLTSNGLTTDEFHKLEGFLTNFTKESIYTHYQKRGNLDKSTMYLKATDAEYEDGLAAYSKVMAKAGYRVTERELNYKDKIDKVVKDRCDLYFKDKESMRAELKTQVTSEVLKDYTLNLEQNKREAANLDTPEKRSAAFGKIAIQEANHGFIAEARKTAAKIENGIYRNSISADIDLLARSENKKDAAIDAQVNARFEALWKEKWRESTGNWTALVNKKGPWIPGNPKERQEFDDVIGLLSVAKDIPETPKEARPPPKKKEEPTVTWEEWLRITEKTFKSTFEHDKKKPPYDKETHEPEIRKMVDSKKPKEETESAIVAYFQKYRKDWFESQEKLKVRSVYIQSASAQEKELHNEEVRKRMPKFTDGQIRSADIATLEGYIKRMIDAELGLSKEKPDQLGMLEPFVYKNASAIFNGLSKLYAEKSEMEKSRFAAEEAKNAEGLFLASKTVEEKFKARNYDINAYRLSKDVSYVTNEFDITISKLSVDSKHPERSDLHRLDENKIVPRK